MLARKTFRVVLLSVTGLALSIGPAKAHFTMVLPLPATTSTGGGKGAAPCGPTSPLSNMVTPVQGGHPLKLSLSETVLHPGHYRVALSINSRAEIPADPPVVTQGGNSVSTTIQNPPRFPILADGLFPHTSGNTPIPFETTIMIPNITCAKCTLQVIQFMAAHSPPFFYHHCADLRITADPALPGADGGTTDARADGGTTDAPAATGGASGSGGAANTGGATGSGGADTGGVTGSSGGAQASGGATGSGGRTGTPTGGAGTGGLSASTGGMSAGTGGASATGGAASGSGGTSPGGTGGDSGTGCACAISDGPTRGAAAWLSGLLMLALSLTAIRRRRRGGSVGPVPPQGM